MLAQYLFKSFFVNISNSFKYSIAFIIIYSYKFQTIGSIAIIRSPNSIVNAFF